jgi:hypothetical protein
MASRATVLVVVLLEAALVVVLVLVLVLLVAVLLVVLVVLLAQNWCSSHPYSVGIHSTPARLYSTDGLSMKGKGSIVDRGGVVLWSIALVIWRLVSMRQFLTELFSAYPFRQNTRCRGHCVPLAAPAALPQAERGY